ncbi:hypothetical protein GCK72_006315 [Caenorhabditis remanei]|uniref:Major facilitator superfamily (MFS) profile domain-containing protein n=1 Tax=Caenorhabditis remanei TaxID=31234 RepID=A0A6A5HEY5_CAERE|nr:hypothetical protein GCK72_006315 [Caenorhabditis remanei]KAF1766358.1 hypothetical protein GCK72_006315 [Caenorhabditis remanei]
MSFDYKQTDFEIENLGNKQERSWMCWGKTRFLILLIGLVCITCTNANMILMNFTVICMNDVISEQKTYTNGTHWLEKSSDISLTFSAAAVGAIFGTIPAVTFIAKYGIRRVLTVYGILSAVGTILMPLAVNYGLITVLIARLFQGIGASVLYSSIGTISESWSPITEIGTFVAFLSSAFQISNIVTMPTAGFLCESALGWRSIYYIFGWITVVFYLVFFWYYNDAPDKHKNVSSNELKKIRDGKIITSSTSKTVQNVKFIQVFTNWEVFEITLAIIGGSTSVICLNNYGPIYLNKVLGLNIRETGYSNAIPYFFAAIVKFAAGPITDKLAHISERIRLIIFALVPQITMAIGFLIMSFTTHVIIAQVAYTFSVVLAGLNVIGMVKCAQIVAEKHLTLIMAVISMSSWVSAFILPIVIGVICPTNSHSEWSRFYLFVAIFVILTNLPFPFLARVSGRKRVSPETKF